MHFPKIPALKINHLCQPLSSNCETEAEKIVRPGVTRLERLVMAAREGATEKRFSDWPLCLPTNGWRQLDSLLVRDESAGPHAARLARPAGGGEHFQGDRGGAEEARLFA